MPSGGVGKTTWGGRSSSAEARLQSQGDGSGCPCGSDSVQQVDCAIGSAGAQQQSSWAATTEQGLAGAAKEGTWSNPTLTKMERNRTMLHNQYTSSGSAYQDKPKRFSSLPDPLRPTAGFQQVRDTDCCHLHRKRTGAPPRDGSSRHQPTQHQEFHPSGRCAGDGQADTTQDRTHIYMANRKELVSVQGHPDSREASPHELFLHPAVKHRGRISTEIQGGNSPSYSKVIGGIARQSFSPDGADTPLAKVLPQ